MLSQDTAVLLYLGSLVVVVWVIPGWLVLRLCWGRHEG